MKRVYVNEEWCLGCHLCEYHCAFANSGKKDMASALMDIQIRRTYESKRTARSALRFPAAIATSRSA